MNSNRLTILRQFLVSQFNHWSLFAIAFGFALILDDSLKCGQLPAWQWGVAGIIYFFMYFVRRNIPQLWASAMLHIPIVILFGLVPFGNVCHCVVFFIFGTVYAAMSIRHQLVFKTMSDNTISMPVVIGITFLMLGLQHYFGIEENDDICKYTVILLIVIYFIQYYLEHFISFVSLNKDSTGCLPAKEILGSGMGLVMLFSVGTVAVLLMSTDFTWLKSIISFFRDTVAAWIRELLSGMRGADPVVIENGEKKTDGLMETLQNIPAQEETILSKIVNVAGTVVIAVAVTIAVILVIFEVIRLIKDLIRIRTKEEELGVVDTYEKLEKKHVRTVKTEKLRGLTPQMKIRRMYKRKISHDRKKIIGNASAFYLNRFTSGECEKALCLDGMSRVYDKARYSGETVTDEDVRAMKDSLK